ncbi:MAG: hypothetical protein HOH93_05435, partial [Phycisphaerae bacterium]|nr:hypothetical protein [Phycisphaerae bacterium]
AKIRNAADLKIPWLLVVGPRDAEKNNVSVRKRGILQDLGAVSMDTFIGALTGEISSRGESKALEICFPDSEFSIDT